MASVPCNAEVALETEPRLIMEQHFYRFRSIDALLGRHAELEAQEIYFASPAQLNAPMEGFKARDSINQAARASSIKQMRTFRTLPFAKSTQEFVKLSLRNPSSVTSSECSRPAQRRSGMTN